MSAMELPRAVRPEDVGISSARLATLSAACERILPRDEDPGATAAYDVLNIPTLILFRGGKEMGRVIGEQTEPALRKFIETAAAK